MHHLSRGTRIVHWVSQRGATAGVRFKHTAGAHISPRTGSKAAAASWQGPTPAAPAADKSNVNTADWLLNAGPVTASLVGALGMAQPPRLARSASLTFGTLPLGGHTVAVVGDNDNGAAAAAQRAVESLGGAPVHAGAEERVSRVVLDATALQDVSQVPTWFAKAQGAVTTAGRNARILVLANGNTGTNAVADSIAAGMKGLCKTMAKEVARSGSSVNLLFVPPGAEEGHLADSLISPMSFFLSDHSAFVTGQSLELGSSSSVATSTVGLGEQQLSGKCAVVTGAARGIGAAIAARLAAEGADLVLVDVPQASDALNDTAQALPGSVRTVECNIAEEAAAARLCAALESRGADVVVHNAGITRDRSLKRMDVARFQEVLEVNLAGIQRLNGALVDNLLLNDHARMVLMSSINGIAGAFGQANYAFTKAALRGYAGTLGHTLQRNGVTVNAIAPGFIETAMTRAVPLLTREFGRRTNAFAQGGLPWDVAAATSFLCMPGSFAVNGQTLRVCGLHMTGE